MWMTSRPTSRIAAMTAPPAAQRKPGTPTRRTTSRKSMLDISFWELVLVAVVGLLVLGPERLPTAIRTGSLWLNRFRRAFSDIKRDIERELGTDELKRDLH